jgi:uncharacterized protein (DUF2141 family)
MFRYVFAGLLLILLLDGRAEAANIIVTIDGVRSSDGNVVAALFSRAEQFPDGDYSDRHTKVKASTSPLTIVFDNLKPGIYAVAAYHDENGNDRFDTNFIGYPAEGYAISNDIRAIISRPRFVDASFVVGDEDKRVTLHIKY